MKGSKSHRAAVVLAIWLVCQATPAGPSHDANGSRYFDSKGVRIHYTDDGQGPPVLLIHGFGMSLDDWSVDDRESGGLPADLLHEDFRVIAFDSRGHGGSDRPHDPALYGVEMVEDARRLLDHLDLERAHVIGISFGGVIANKLRELYPERTASVVLGGIGVPDPDTDPGSSFVPATIASLERGEGLWPMGRFLFPDGTEEWLRALNERIMAANDPRALVAVLRGRDELNVSRAGLERNRVPVLAIIGSDDPFMRDFRRMTKTMALVEPVVLDGEDHFSLINSPGFRQRVVAFVTQHSKVDSDEPPG